jgi:hypothetical protein
MSAQNNGVSRFQAIPLNAFGTAYIQASNFTPGGGLADTGIVAVGKTQPDTELNLTNPTSAYVELGGGPQSIIDFHTGDNADGYVNYDARLLVENEQAGNGGGSLEIINAGTSWKFMPGGTVEINGLAGAVGQVLTIQANGKPAWQALPP